MLPEKFSGGVSVREATIARISASDPVTVKPLALSPVTDPGRAEFQPSTAVAGTPVTTTLSMVSDPSGSCRPIVIGSAMAVSSSPLAAPAMVTGSATASTVRSTIPVTFSVVRGSVKENVKEAWPE